MTSGTARDLATLSFARQKTPNDPALRRKQAILLEELGQWRAARATLDRLVTDHPDDLDSALARVALCRRSGDLAAAAAGSAALLARTAHAQPEVQLAHVETLRRQGRPKAAMALLQHIQPEWGNAPAHLWRKRAALLRSSGHPNRARELLRQASEIHPDDAHTRCDLIDVLLHMGLVARAEACLRDGISRAPHHPALCSQAARIALRHGAHDTALMHLDQAKTAHPHHIGLALRRIDVLRDKGALHSARSETETLATHHPHALPVHLIHIAVLRDHGLTDRATERLDRLTAQLPDHPALLDLCITQACEREDLAALTPLAEQAQAQAPHDPEALRRLARCCLRQVMQPGAQATRHLGVLAEHADRLGPVLAWQSAHIASQIGEDTIARRLLASAMTRPRYTDAEATALLIAGHVALAEDSTDGDETSGWPVLARQLADRVMPQTRAAFDLERITLQHGAEAALHARTAPNLPRRPTEVLALHGVLLQAGRLALAARYMRRARARHPREPGLLLRHVSTLLLMGDGQGARAELAPIQNSDHLADDGLRVAAVHGLIAAGLPDQAEVLIAQVRDPRHALRLRHPHLRLHLRFGRFDAAQALMDALRDTAPLARIAHLNPSLEGAELTEGHLSAAWGDTPPPLPDSADALRYLAPAVAAFDALGGHASARSAQPKGEIPAQVMQYWNTQPPPPALTRIMDSWRDIPGLRYERFDKPGALRFLADHFDLDWVTALNMAQHPAQESDFFRLCWLAARGGIYVDCDDRLTGNWRHLVGPHGLTLYREGYGALSNNVICAPPVHPAIVNAAVQAKAALLNRDNDSTWSKTGPGLLTRVVAAWLLRAHDEGLPPDITLLPRHATGRVIQVHTPLPYKRAPGYWNRTQPLGFGPMLRTILQEIPR